MSTNSGLPAGYPTGYPAMTSQQAGPAQPMNNPYPAFPPTHHGSITTNGAPPMGPTYPAPAGANGPMYGVWQQHDTHAPQAAAQQAVSAARLQVGVMSGPSLGAAPATAAATRITGAGHAPAAAWNKVTVVDSRFCAPQQTTLVLRERHGPFKTDNFTITDINGQACFKLDASTFSLHSSRKLLDAAGNPVIEMKHKLVSLHGTWVMTNMLGQKLAEIKPAILSLKPVVKVYLNDGDKEADYVIKGNFLAKKFDIKQVTTGGEVLIASVKKESRFASAKAFLLKVISDADKYFLTIEAGVDAAFVTALALLCDEVFHDQKGNGSLMGLVG